MWAPDASSRSVVASCPVEPASHDRGLAGRCGIRGFGSMSPEPCARAPGDDRGEAGGLDTGRVRPAHESGVRRGGRECRLTPAVRIRGSWGYRTFIEQRVVVRTGEIVYPTAGGFGMDVAVCDRVCRLQVVPLGSQVMSALTTIGAGHVQVVLAGRGDRSCQGAVAASVAATTRAGIGAVRWGKTYWHGCPGHEDFCANFPRELRPLRANS